MVTFTALYLRRAFPALWCSTALALGARLNCCFTGAGRRASEQHLPATRSLGVSSHALICVLLLLSLKAAPSLYAGSSRYSAGDGLCASSAPACTGAFCAGRRPLGGTVRMGGRRLGHFTAIFCSYPLRRTVICARSRRLRACDGRDMPSTSATCQPLLAAAAFSACRAAPATRHCRRFCRRWLPRRTPCLATTPRLPTALRCCLPPRSFARRRRSGGCLRRRRTPVPSFLRLFPSHGALRSMAAFALLAGLPRRHGGRLERRSPRWDGSQRSLFSPSDGGRMRYLRVGAATVRRRVAGRNTAAPRPRFSRLLPDSLPPSFPSAREGSPARRRCLAYHISTILLCLHRNVGAGRLGMLLVGGVGGDGLRCGGVAATTLQQISTLYPSLPPLSWQQTIYPHAGKYMLRLRFITRQRRCLLRYRWRRAASVS